MKTHLNLKKIINLILLIIIIVFPFVNKPVLFILTSLIFVIVNIKAISLKNTDLPFFLYFAFVLINIIYTKNIDDTLIFGYLLLFVILIRGPIEKTDKEDYEKFFFVAGLFLIMYGIYQRFILYPYFVEELKKLNSSLLNSQKYIEYMKYNRPLGFYKSTNIFAIIPLILAYNYLKKIKLGYILFAIIFLIMFYLTKSFNLIIFFLILLFPMIHKQYRIPLFVFLIIIIVVLSIIKTDYFYSFLNIDARIRYYKTAMKMFQKHPFFGYGISDFKSAYVAYNPGEYVKYVHNIILQHLCDGGIIFLLLFLYLIYTIYKKLPADERYLPTAILVHNLFSFSFYSSSVFLLFFIFYYIYKQKKQDYQKENSQ